MEDGKLTSATKFWIGLVGYVLLADGILWRRGHHTMSVQFGKWVQTRRGKLTCGAIWGGLTAHLFWSMPLPGQTTLKKVATFNGKRK